MRVRTAERSPTRGRSVTRPKRLRRLATGLVALAASLALAGCASFGNLLNPSPVLWTDSTVGLAVYLDMSPLPAPFQQSDGADDVGTFVGNVETGGSYTIGEDVVCAFDLAANASYTTNSVFGNYIDGFSGDYAALGDGFNDPAECIYDTDATFEWVIEFEVVEAVQMQVQARLQAAVTPPVVGRSLHYVLVRAKGATTPLWSGESDVESVDQQFQETLDLEPGLYEFAVYARPRLQGTTGVASISSGWDYAVDFIY